MEKVGVLGIVAVVMWPTSLSCLLPTPPSFTLLWVLDDTRVSPECQVFHKHQSYGELES